MDKQIDIEALRTYLKGMTRGQARTLAVNASLSPATVEKFRLNHITEPRQSKLVALNKAIAAHRKANPPVKPPVPA
ncbi:MAG: hypothetical protein V4718_04300 [Pseudomonadota bacterium]